MKKFTAITIMSISLCQTPHVLSINLSGITSAIKAVASKAFIPTITTRQMTTVATIGVSCLIAHAIYDALYDQSNTLSESIIEDKKENGEPFLYIKADGLITVQAGNKDQKIWIRTEQIDLDTQAPSSLFEKKPAQRQLNWLEKLWYTIWQPAHRRVSHHIITVPENRPIKVLSTNKHPYAHRYPNVITIEHIKTSITATANSGDIHIINPGACVQVDTPNSMVIDNFKNEVHVKGGHLKATRAKGNAQCIFFNKQKLINKGSYAIGQFDEVEKNN